jgi:hypothetical protein
MYQSHAGSPRNEEPSEFRSALQEDDAHLLTAVEDVLFDEDSGAYELQSRWHVFEAALLRHLRAEEELLIPSFELARPDDAARIRFEHHRIRELLAELEHELERGVLDRECVARLVAMLRLCSSFKESQLYAWAEHELPARSKARVVDRIRGSSVPPVPRASGPVVGA